MQLPKLSIVVAVYNRADTLIKCIESVLRQKYVQKELIVIDGGSDDGTVEILKKYNDDITYWESVSDKGIYYALNKGIAKASGEWILILGADDYLWADDVLEKASRKLLQVNPPSQIVYGKVALVDKNYHIVEIRGKAWSAETQKIFFVERDNIPHQGVFHHQSLFKLYGNFVEDYKCAGDYEFLLRVLAKNNRQAIFFDDLIVSGMRNDGFSNQRNHAVAGLFEEIRARKEALNSHLSKYKLVCKLTRAYVKQLSAKIFGENFVASLLYFYNKIRSH